MNDCKVILIGDYMAGQNVKGRDGQLCEVINIGYVGEYVGRNYVGEAMLLFVRWPDGSNSMHREASSDLRRATVDEMLHNVIAARRECFDLFRRVMS